MTQLIRAGWQTRSQFVVTLRCQSAHLVLTGEVDMATAPELTRTLEGLDRMPAMTLYVDLAAVTFLDSAGVRPLVEVARRRRDHEWPPLLIGDVSRPARRLLVTSGLGEGPALDVDGWDRTR